MIHLIASDIDGTLLQGGQTRLDPALFDVIERLEQHGIRFAAASGRQYTNLRRLFAPVADKIDYICENGSLVISDTVDNIREKEGKSVEDLFREVFKC